MPDLSDHKYKSGTHGTLLRAIVVTLGCDGGGKIEGHCLEFILDTMYVFFLISSCLLPSICFLLVLNFFFYRSNGSEN